MEVYLAINGDDVGAKIGEAIANDDQESLAGVTGSVNSGLSICKDWAEKSGGEVLSSSGDECLIKVPQEAVNELNEIKAACEKECGHSMTIGMGSSMSEAAKALIYGKLNGKNQVVEYDESVEQGIREDEGAEEEEQALEEEFESDEEGTEEIDVPEDEIDGDYGSEEMADAQPEHEQDMSEEEEFVHDAQENRADELDEDNIEADEEYEDSDEGYEEEYDEEDAEAIEGDEEEGLDGKYDGDEEAPIEDEYEEGEEALEEDADEEDMMAPEEEEYNHNDMLEDMMDANMEEGSEEEIPQDEMMEEPMEEEYPDEMMEEEDPSMGMEPEGEDDDSALREDIFHALQVFKQNKDMLEQSAQTNPMMYQATMGMLRSMIAMAHKLGYTGPQDDAEPPMESEVDDMGEDDEAMMMRRMGKSEKIEKGWRESLAAKKREEKRKRDEKAENAKRRKEGKPTKLDEAIASVNEKAKNWNKKKNNPEKK